MEGVLGYITLFAGTAAPENWSFCDGSLIVISDNTLLFSIISNKYGGDGVNNFRLPDCRGRMVVGTGQGSGLSPYSLAQSGGTYEVVLGPGHMPEHLHQVTFNGQNPSTESAATTDIVNGSVYAAAGSDCYSSSGTASGAAFNATLITSDIGNSMPVNIQRPMLGLNYIICVNGMYPSPQ